MFNWLRAKFAAKRLGLRDRGPIGREWTSATEYVQEVHRACRTRIRIGITQDKRTVKYCWRCEEMLEHPHHVSPPKQTVTSSDKKVIPFKRD